MPKKIILNTDLIYPIGAIYLSVDSTNPSKLFGGTWEQISKGRTLVGVDTSQTEFNTAKKIGGEKTHKLTLSEIPQHDHNIHPRWNTAAGAAFVYGSNGTGQGGEYDGIHMQGSDQPHNNLQPYFTCYIWERIA